MLTKILAGVGIAALIMTALLFLLRVTVTERLTNRVVVNETLDSVIAAALKPKPAGETWSVSDIVSNLVTIHVGLRF